MLFAFAMEPRKLPTMMDELDDLPPGRRPSWKRRCGRWKKIAAASSWAANGSTMMNKRVGDQFTLYGINYRDIDLEVDVVGTFPEGRYDKSTGDAPRLSQRGARSLTSGKRANRIRWPTRR